jgi:(p)ppGpp synthase/HD superfamily hydrolase
MSLTDARELAIRAHADQLDRDGSFHIAHVARVAANVAGDEPTQRVAWLHDVIEDSDLAAEDLEERLSLDEIQALKLLTHDTTAESYERYVARIIDATGAVGELARAVKEADMLDNLHRCARDHDPAVVQYGHALAALWTSARNA